VVYDIVNKLPADLVMLAHEGSKAYSESYELFHRREAEGPNAIWQADHTPLDILVLRPDGQAANPWLSIVIDDYSRAIAGYLLSFEDPSALQTSLALRQAIWRKKIRAGLFAASRAFCTPIATSRRDIWSRSVRILRSDSSSLFPVSPEVVAALNGSSRR